MLQLPLHQTAVDGGNIMSKFIPGNQKHLTLEDRIFIQNELNKGTTFKDIARFLCKDPTTISKKLKQEESLTGIIKARSSIKKPSVFIDIIVEKRMLVTKLFFVGLNVLPVRPVTKHVTTSKKNVAIVWIEHLMFVMGVIRKSITVRLPINTTTTLKLLIVYIVIPYPILAQGSI